MNKNQILIINGAMEIATVDGKVVIFEPTGERIYLLGEEEKDILHLFDGMNNLGDVETRLRSFYEEDENFSQDLEEYINALKEKGVLIEKE